MIKLESCYIKYRFMGLWVIAHTRLFHRLVTVGRNGSVLSCGAVTGGVSRGSMLGLGWFILMNYESRVLDMYTCVICTSNGSKILT